MSSEPICEFCGVSVKPRCQTRRRADGCPAFTEEKRAAYLDRGVRLLRQVSADHTRDAGKMMAPRRHRQRPVETDHFVDANTMVKATNPKDRIASNKLPLDLVPDTLCAYAALAFVEGAAKYGAYNWRVAGVRASVYRAALDRHLKSWWNGEDADPLTGVPHLASIIACAGILLDAGLADKLTDDRPPRVGLGEVLRGLEAEVARIRELFAGHRPTHWTAQNAADASGQPAAP